MNSAGIFLRNLPDAMCLLPEYVFMWLWGMRSEFFQGMLASGTVLEWCLMGN